MPWNRRHRIGLVCTVVAALSAACTSNDTTTPAPEATESAVERNFGGRIDLDDLPNYAAQTVPDYIGKDNGTANPVTDAGATLGRVLFYDKNLSSDGTVACASCHHQAFAFGDTARASTGVGGVTERHSMRLINARFAREVHFFWDERAVSLEDQATIPIHSHTEMGFSGQDGDPAFDELIERLETTDYYGELFAFVYGDAGVTEDRIQRAIAQFVRSIQSFDSRYDAGRVQVGDDAPPFPNFTPRENMGKQLFLTPPQFGPDGVRVGGGLGCAGCHEPPEFDIDPNSMSNGVFVTIDGAGGEFTVTRAPSLRDVVKGGGASNGGFFHSGLSELASVVEHYNNIQLAPNLDPRLKPGGNPQNLALTAVERNAVVAFLRTLAGSAVYTDDKWSDPFAAQDN